MDLQSKWVRSFRIELCSNEIPMPKPKREDEYPHPPSIFKVTSTLFPLGSPEAATEIVVYKHFSDFVRLHATLKSLHHKLFPSKGKEFPVLPKGAIHCHSDLSQMEERRVNSLLLLEFSAQIPQLYNSAIFTSFTMTNSASHYELDSYQVEDVSHLENDNSDESLSSSESEKYKLTSCGSPSLEEVLLLAEISEEKSEINESVSHYKKAIKKLLDKAKFLREENPMASKSLSRRASEYLQKVESLIKKPDRDKDISKMETLAKDCRETGNKIPYSDLFGDVKDLNRYKVKEIISGKNIRALDTRRGNMMVILKTLQKSSIIFKSGRTSLLPINIRFMVKLICYYETEDFIYLILENICYGKIYDLVDYIFSCPYTILDSKSGQSLTQMNNHFLNTSDDCDDEYENSDEDELTRVEIRDDGLFCFDKDGIEDISFRCEDKGMQSDKKDNIEIGEEVLGPHFLNYREIPSTTKRKTKRKENSLLKNSPEPKYIFDFFPESAQKESLLPLHLIRKWTFQMCQVLFGLHARNIIVKDLNPDNLLLDESCNLKLTYQCQWVSVDKPLSSEAVDGGYVAPELSYVEPLTPTCDWWSVGVILFELSSGVRFSDMYPSGLLSHTPIQFPNQIAHLIDEELKDFVEQLMQPIPHLRLGAGSDGPSSIKGHPFLKMYDLKSEESRKISL